MKLKLVALAVSALAAGAASAQTANVTLYGLVDAFVANVRTSGPGGSSVNVVNSGGLSGSRWGLRGSESLGGGLNAIFTLEGGFNVDTGTTGASGTAADIFARQAFVGVSGGFGAITLGRQYSPAFYVACTAGVDGCSNFSHEINHIVLPLASTVLRVNNSVNFKTANMGGFTAAAMYGFGENVLGNSRDRLIGFNAEFSNGPIYAGAAWADRKNSSGGNLQRTWLVGGSFNAQVAKLSAIYGEQTIGTNFKFWQLGATVPMGNVGLVAQYGQGKVGPAKQNLFNVGADYNLSKRSNLYVRIANADNNAASSFNAVAFGGATQGLGQDKRIIGAGIRHRF